MNIADSGTIPPVLQTVVIEFNCNGIDAEILVHFNFILFLDPKSNATTPVSFHRRKICSMSKHFEFLDITVFIDLFTHSPRFFFQNLRKFPTNLTKKQLPVKVLIRHN